MALLFVGLWVAGGVPAAVLGEVVQAENPRTARAGRIAFALLLGFDLLLAAVVLSVGNSAATAHMTRSLWWLTVLLGGIPLALVSGLAVRRGYAGHRLALAVATLTTAVLYVAFPLAYTPVDQSPTGLGRWAHDHHLLGIAILFIPSLILLANELRWKQEAIPAAESSDPSLRSMIRVIPRRNLIGAGIFILGFVWLAGTNGPGLLVGLGAWLVGVAAFLWHWNRSTMRDLRRDLKPPEKP
jgi:hypothetical protein